VQLLMTLPGLRRLGFPIWRLRLPRRDDPLVRRVLMLMLPVSVGLGLINIDLVLNSMIGSLVSDQAPAAIDKAFRVYMLPQGMFSVAVATVVFPQLSRLASRSEFGQMRSVLGVGMRQIALLLVPGGGRHDRARAADRRGALPARRVRRRVDRPRDDRALGVRDLAAVQRLEPDPHAHVLLAPAARGCRPRSRSARSRSTSPSRSRCTRSGSRAWCSAPSSPTPC
jgi:hypothetical protein